jgi:hypothetical protein
MGLPGTSPGTYRDWTDGHPTKPFGWRLAAVDREAGSPAVAIVLQPSLARTLRARLDGFRCDLESAGYTVFNYEVEGGSPESLRCLLADAHSADSIEGVLLIGDLPVPWYQAKNLHGKAYGEWPVDLYYMDLDGIWLDSLRHDQVDTLVPGSDSIFDVHRGDVEPEIYVGRLTPTGLNDWLMLRCYFEKNHQFRHAEPAPNQQALVFVDDDWEDWADDRKSEVGKLYPALTLVADPESTRASKYRRMLNSGWAWVSLIVHSSVYHHAFYQDSGTVKGRFECDEYYYQDPPVRFFNFITCYFCRYTTPGYGGGLVVFNPTHALAAVGSTSEGGMWSGSSFYESLGDGRSLGQAFLGWFKQLSRGGFSHDDVCWYYGMTLLGDPFLVPRQFQAGDATGLALLAAPNPTRGRAIARFVVPQDGDTRLSLLDVAGRRQAVVLDASLDSGLHDASVDLTQLPRGVYLLLLESGGGRCAVKLVRH